MSTARKLKAKKSHFRSDAEFCGPDEEEPLSKVVAHEHEVVAVWHRLYELVPGEDEVGKHEKDGAEGEKAAALQHCTYHHDADENRIDAYSYADDACRGLRSDLEECNAKKCEGAEYDHCQISFCLAGELFVGLNLSEIASAEIYYVEYVPEGEESHLPQEIVAGSHMVAEGREQQGKCDLPRT